MGAAILALLGFYLVFGVGICLLAHKGKNKRPPGPGASGSRPVSVIHRHLISGVAR